MAVAVISNGHQRLDGAFEAGGALGEGLDIGAQVRHLGMDVLSQALVAGLNFGAKGVVFGLGIRAQVLDFSTDFGAECLIVGTESLAVGAKVLDFGAQSVHVGARVTPDREYQSDESHAHSKDADEFRGHWAAPMDQLAGLRSARVGA